MLRLREALLAQRELERRWKSDPVKFEISMAENNQGCYFLIYMRVGNQTACRSVSFEEFELCEVNPLVVALHTLAGFIKKDV